MANALYTKGKEEKLNKHRIRRNRTNRSKSQYKRILPKSRAAKE